MTKQKPWSSYRPEFAQHCKDRQYAAAGRLTEEQKEEWGLTGDWWFGANDNGVELFKDCGNIFIIPPFEIKD